MKARTTTEGFSALEITIATTVLMVAATAIVSSVRAALKLSRINRELALAAQAATDAVEEIRALPLSEAFRRFNASPDDDPATGPSPGHQFAAPGLKVRVTDPDGFAGEVFFPEVGGRIREDVVDAELSMPRDLNGDGVIDGADHSSDYEILPVRVRVEWTGLAGDQRLEVFTMLTKL